MKNYFKVLKKYFSTAKHCRNKENKPKRLRLKTPILSLVAIVGALWAGNRLYTFRETECKRDNQLARLETMRFDFEFNRGYYFGKYKATGNKSYYDSSNHYRDLNSNGHRLKHIIYGVGPDSLDETQEMIEKLEEGKRIFPSACRLK